MITSDSTKSAGGDKKVSKVGGVGMRTIVFGLMMVASVGPLALFAVSSFEASKTRLIASAEDVLKSTSLANASKVSDWIASQEMIAKSLAADPALKNPANLAVIEPLLWMSLNQQPGYYGIATVGPDGQQLGRGGPGNKVNVVDRPYFSDVMRGAKTGIGSGISRATGKGAFFVSAPINVAGQELPIGVLAMYANLTQVTDSVTGGKVGQTGFSYLVDNTGLTLAHPDEKKISAKLDERLNQLLVASGQGVVKDVTLAGGSVVKVVANKTGGNLVLVTQIDNAEVYAQVDEIKQRAFIFVGLGIFVAAVIAFVLSSGISRKIKALVDATLNVSQARKVEDVVRIEREIDAIGGARELRDMAHSVKKLTTVVKMIMQKSNRTA